MPANNPQPLLSEPWAKHFEKGGGRKQPSLADGTVGEMYGIARAGPRGRAQVFTGHVLRLVGASGRRKSVQLGWERYVEVSS